MQQMYSCPGCGAPVAYGQPQCSNCQTVFDWQGQDQYQHPGQQQWYPPSPDYQQADWDSQAADQGQADSGIERLRQRIAGAQQVVAGLRQWGTDHSGIIARVSIVVVIVSALAGTGFAMREQIEKWTSAPVVAAFELGSPTIVAGQETTLRWEVNGASSITISPGIGNVFPRGSRSVSPGESTTYTLVAGNLFGTVRKSATILVKGKLPDINNFSINPDSIYAGQTATLTWNVADAMSVSIEPGIGPVSPGGTKSISPGTTTQYVLTASNRAGNSTAAATLNVILSSVPVITSFEASPASILAGEVSTLAWDVVGAKSINISQGIGGVASKSSVKVSPAVTTTYMLTAISDYGSITRSVTVSVDTAGTKGGSGAEVASTPPSISAFSGNRPTVTLGENVTLTWAVSRARTVSISPDVGTVPSSGWTTVLPVATTTYTLSAVNTFGTQKAEVTITVNTSAEGVPPIIRSFTASPGSISAGGTSTLSWNVKGATLLIIDHGVGILTSQFSQIVSPSENTTYKLTAINSTGTATATAIVNVAP